MSESPPTEENTLNTQGNLPLSNNPPSLHQNFFQKNPLLKWLIPAGVVLIVILVVAIYYANGEYSRLEQIRKNWVSKNSKTPYVSTEQPIKNFVPIKIAEYDTSSWKTYRNEELGFSFKYPADIYTPRLQAYEDQSRNITIPYVGLARNAILEEIKKGVCCASNTDTITFAVADNKVIKKSAGNPEEYFGDGLLTQYAVGDGDYQPDIQQSSIGHNGAWRVNNCCGGAAEIESQIYTIYYSTPKGRIYEITVYKEDKAAKEIHQAILSSFAFVSPKPTPIQTPILDTANWKVYTAPDGTFSFKYPPHLTPKEHTNTIKLYEVAKGNKPADPKLAGKAVSFFRPITEKEKSTYWETPPETIEEFSLFYTVDPKYKNFDLREIITGVDGTISEKNSLTLDNTIPATEYIWTGGVDIVFKKNPRIYGFHQRSLTNDAVTNIRNAVSTFTFLK